MAEQNQTKDGSEGAHSGNVGQTLNSRGCSKDVGKIMKNVRRKPARPGEPGNQLVFSWWCTSLSVSEIILVCNKGVSVVGTRQNQGEVKKGVGG